MNQKANRFYSSFPYHPAIGDKTPYIIVIRETISCKLCVISELDENGTDNLVLYIYIFPLIE